MYTQCCHRCAFYNLSRCHKNDDSRWSSRRNLHTRFVPVDYRRPGVDGFCISTSQTACTLPCCRPTKTSSNDDFLEFTCEQKCSRRLSSSAKSSKRSSDSARTSIYTSGSSGLQPSGGITRDIKFSSAWAQRQLAAANKRCSNKRSFSWKIF